MIRKTIAISLLTMLMLIGFIGAGNTNVYAASKAPAKVTNLKMTKKSETSFSVKWKKARNTKKYQVYLSTNKKKFKKIETVKKQKATVTGLTAGKTYYIKIRGVYGKKKGKFSNVFEVETLPKKIKKDPAYSWTTHGITLLYNIPEGFKETGKSDLDGIGIIQYANGENAVGMVVTDADTVAMDYIRKTITQVGENVRTTSYNGIAGEEFWIYDQIEYIGSILEYNKCFAFGCKNATVLIVARSKSEADCNSMMNVIAEDLTVKF